MFNNNSSKREIDILPQEIIKQYENNYNIKLSKSKNLNKQVSMMESNRYDD